MNFIQLADGSLTQIENITKVHFGVLEETFFMFVDTCGSSYSIKDPALIGEFLHQLNELTKRRYMTKAYVPGDVVEYNGEHYTIANIFSARVFELLGLNHYVIRDWLNPVRVRFKSDDRVILNEKQGVLTYFIWDAGLSQYLAHVRFGSTHTEAVLDELSKVTV